MHEITSNFLSIKEVAQYLGFHDMTIYRLIKEKKLEAYKIAGNWRVSKDKLKLYIENRSNLNK